MCIDFCMDSAHHTIVRFQPLSASTTIIIIPVEADNGWNRTIVQCAESMQKSMHMHKILVSPRQTAIYVMYPTAHDIWSLFITTPPNCVRKLLCYDLSISSYLVVILSHYRHFFIFNTALIQLCASSIISFCHRTLAPSMSIYSTGYVFLTLILTHRTDDSFSSTRY